MTSARSRYRSPPYALLFALFLSLSVVIFLLYQKYEREYSTALVIENTSTLPTSPPDPTLSTTQTLLPTSSVAIPTLAPSVAPSPTPTIQSYRNSDDNFQVIHKSDRKIYEEKYASGNRHVFYSPAGNITVHVGTDWSWFHSGREFSDSFLVSGQPTFVYSITSQKLVDF